MDNLRSLSAPAADARPDGASDVAIARLRELDPEVRVALQELLAFPLSFHARFQVLAIEDDGTIQRVMRSR